MSIFTWLFASISGIIHLISGIFDRMRQKELIDQGKQQATTEIANKISEKEAAITKKQTEILMQERPADSTIKKLDDGSF